jgi:hypothetical protein
MFEAKEIITQNSDWIAFVFLIILLNLTIVKLLFKERLSNTNTLFFSKKYLSIYFTKEKTNVFNLFQFSMFIVQVLSLSLFFYVFANYFQFDLGVYNLDLFLIIASSVSGYFIIKFVIGFFLASIFEVLKMHKKIVYQKINYLNNLILWLLPFLILLLYAPKYQTILFKITLIIFGLLLIIRYSLLLVNNKKLIFRNLLYFILYICALEIAPFVIILKLTI